MPILVDLGEQERGVEVFLQIVYVFGTNIDRSVGDKWRVANLPSGLATRPTTLEGVFSLAWKNERSGF